VNAAAQKWGVDPGTLTAQLYHESGYNKDAVSPAGAKGIGQFMPATAKQYGIDPSDPNQSIDAAAHYVSDLQKKYNGNPQLALAAYNWGPGNVDKWLNGKQGWQMPQETQDYVRNITGKPIQNPNVPSQGAAAMEAAIPGQGFVPPPGQPFGGLPDRSVFSQGSLADALKQPVPPAGTMENAKGQVNATFNAQEGQKAAQEAMKPTPAPAPPKPVPASASPVPQQNQQQQQASPFNFNQMNPQMQKLWNYMLLRTLMPQPQFRNVGYDPWAVYRLSKEGY
jgi:hypothetical protein